jgi:penicillin-binding protein 1A
VQDAVDNVYTDLSKIPATLGSQQLQSAIVIIDNKTGDIVAMSGGVGEKRIADAWNRAVDAIRQPGSSIKPLAVYAQALERGLVNTATIIEDLPVTYNNGKPYPLNDTRTYSSKRSIWYGIVYSVNAVSLNTLEKVGLSNSFDFTKNQLGLGTLVESITNSAGVSFSDIGYAPLGMGAFTYGVTVRDMSSAYATFANNGTYREGRTYLAVLDDQGRKVLDNQQDSRKLFSEKTINYINLCMTDAVSVGYGTADRIGSGGDGSVCVLLV